jgi:hypothetical protein
MKQADEYFESKDPLYKELMVEALKAQRREKTTPSTEQSASTAAILARPESEDEKWRNRPFLSPEQIYAHGKIDQARMLVDEDYYRQVTGFRKVTEQEVNLIEGMRRQSKNTLGDAVSTMGASSVSQESKERAINAFMYSPPAKLTPLETQNLTELKKMLEPPKIPYAEKKRKPIKALFWEVTGWATAASGLVYMGWRFFQ